MFIQFLALYRLTLYLCLRLTNFVTLECGKASPKLFDTPISLFVSISHIPYIGLGFLLKVLSQIVLLAMWIRQKACQTGPTTDIMMFFTCSSLLYSTKIHV